MAIVIKLSLVGKQLPEKYLSFIDSERGGFGVIFPEVMIFPRGFAPRKISSLREISTNPPSGGSINVILYRKLKNSLSSE